MKQITFSLLALLYSIYSFAQEANKSDVWVADLGNGTYKNPIINAEYSDPDICRVGSNYYMIASSFNSVPGLPILHSNDLVNWQIIGHVLNKLIPEEHFKQPQHGAGVWAPAIRYHKDEFYIYYGDPDFGIYMTKAKKIEGPWEPLTLVMEGKGLIDPCPLFDDNGVYMAYAFAGSRAGIKSLLAMTKLTADGKKVVGESRIIYDGHDVDPTIEGPKLYKRNGYYYIFAPAGGVSTGWQVVLRSKNIWGPYERKIVMAQGETPINGPHQGGWINTITGEDWFIHFQDAGTFGRLLHLQPMKWNNDWPVIGEDKLNTGCGQPVLSYKKPNVGRTYPITTPADSDEFNNNELGLQWQWNANPEPWWYFANSSKGCLSLYSVPVPADYTNLWDIPNMLLQKIPAPQITATMKLSFHPNPAFTGEKTGLIIMGLDYALLSIENMGDNFCISQIECLKADRKGKEVLNESVQVNTNTLYLQVKIEENARCTFYYSLDGKKYKSLGNSFTARKGRWIGAKIGTFCTRNSKNNDGGRVDIDWFRIN